MNTPEAIEKTGMLKRTAEACDDGINPDYKKDIEFCDFILSALRAQEERENPQPLSRKEVIDRDGKPVFMLCHDKPELSEWVIVVLDIWDFEGYGTEWVCYDHEPKAADINGKE